MQIDGLISSRIPSIQTRNNPSGSSLNPSTTSVSTSISDGSKTENPSPNEVCGQQPNGSDMVQYSQTSWGESISTGSVDMDSSHMVGHTQISYQSFRLNSYTIRCHHRNSSIHFVEYWQSYSQISHLEISSTPFSVRVELRRMNELSSLPRCIRRSLHLSRLSMRSTARRWVHSR